MADGERQKKITPTQIHSGGGLETLRRNCKTHPRHKSFSNTRCETRENEHSKSTAILWGYFFTSTFSTSGTRFICTFQRREKRATLARRRKRNTKKSEIIQRCSQNFGRDRPQKRNLHSAASHKRLKTKSVHHLDQREIEQQR